MVDHPCIMYGYLYLMEYNKSLKPNATLIFVHYDPNTNIFLSVKPSKMVLLAEPGSVLENVHM